MKYTWNKKEHLKSRKAIDLLFREGTRDKKYPIQLIFISKTNAQLNSKKLHNTTQVGFSVPKKLYSNAVDRNRIRRQMREAYRLNKFIAPSSYFLFFIYYSREKLSFDKIQHAIQSLLMNINNNS